MYVYIHIYILVYSFCSQRKFEFSPLLKQQLSSLKADYARIICSVWLTYIWLDKPISLTANSQEMVLHIQVKYEDGLKKDGNGLSLGTCWWLGCHQIKVNGQLEDILSLFCMIKSDSTNPHVVHPDSQRQHKAEADLQLITAKAFLQTEWSCLLTLACKHIHIFCLFPYKVQLSSYLFCCSN